MQLGPPLNCGLPKASSVLGRVAALPLLRYLSQHAQRWRIEERVVFDQVDARSWLQRLKWQFPQRPIRHDAKCFLAAQLFLGRLEQQIVELARRVLVTQITFGQHAAEFVHSLRQLV